METRASHILVGGFVLLLLSGLIAFAVWIAKVDLDAEYRDYDIYMEGSVFGLVKRSVVYYQGIPVGEVRDIELAKHDPSKVEIQIRIDAAVPIVEGSVARLEYQGFTGVGYIELTGGAPGGAIIQAIGDRERAVIPAERSSIQEVFTGAPDLINEAISTIQQVKKLLSDDNIARISNTLAHTEKVASNVEAATNDLDSLVRETKTALSEISTTANRLGSLAETGEQVLNEEARILITETTAAMEQAKQLLARVDGMVAANEGTVTNFVSTSLPEVSRAINDLRATSRNLSRLMSRLEEDPIGAILDPGKPKYDVKSRKVDK